MYSIKYLGKLYKFNTINDLSKSLGVDKATARKLVNDILNKKHYRKTQGGSLVDIRKPLLQKHFTELQNKPKFNMNINKEIIQGGALFTSDLSGSDDAYDLLETLKDIGEGDMEIKLEATMTFKFFISKDEPKNRKNYTYTFEYEGTINDLDYEDIGQGLLQDNGWNLNEINGLDVAVNIEDLEIDDSELDEEGEALLNNFMADMELQQTNPMNISTLYNEVYMNEGGSCIQRYLKKSYPSLSKKKIDELKTTRDIYKWATNYNIKMIAYDICGNVILSNYPKEVKRKHRPTCIFIAYNNHLYPLKNTILKKVKKPITGFVNHNLDINDEFMKLIRKKELPEKIFLGSGEHNKVKMFHYDGKLNLNNMDYQECKEILELYGLSDYLRPTTNLKNIGEIIFKLYTNESLFSFLPNNRRFVKGGFTYLKEDEIDMYEDDKDAQILYDVMTIDKNKSYPYNLKTLPYLLTTDIRYCKHRKGKFLVRNLVPHFLYIVYPKESSILLPDANIYTGSHLKFCAKEGLSFEITEELETYKHHNSLKDFVGDMWNKVKMGQINEKSFKFIMNVFIGKMEQNIEYEKVSVVEKFSSLDECRRTDMKTIRYNDKYGFNVSYDDKFSIKNMKPINIQIKDKSRVNLYNMMKKLSIDAESILQVKIDSITFRCDPLTKEKVDEEIEEYALNDIDGWKKEATCMLNSQPYIEEKSPTFNYTKCNNTLNTLGMCYAGCGKTYKIVNEIIPKLNDDYIVVSPSHSTLKEYKRLGLNAKVIQYYQFKCSIPEETNIIVDEFGMVGKGGLDMIYKCYLKGKRIWAYGDFSQLKSVEGHIYDKPLWLDLIFSRKDNLIENHRNHFTKEYYDRLINSTDKDYLFKQVKKHSTKSYKDTELIIVYKNTTRKEYNKKKVRDLGFNSKTDIGVLLICITNDLRKKDLYNKFMVRVVKKEDDKVIVSDDVNEYELDEKEIEKNFDYGYARTIYSVQGESVKSYYYAEEDKDFLNGRTAYTIISRLKTK
tara:strand:- start:187 stop:3201 length:3015 start_codon:yes stop_codon:yes gene_type:complete